ncbi:MAG: GNAT family N-acetyltransferase, partial [Planctomycetota bacterium]
QGQLNFERSANGDDLAPWVSDFRKLEASGWKGEQKSAILSDDRSITFFDDLVGSLQSENAITFARITLDGQILAMLIDVRMNDRVYGFKTAFNESFADHSPGMLIEYENLKSLHSEQCLLFDACCGPDNGLLNSLYTDRLSFQDFVIGLTPSMSPFVSRVMPTMQSIAMKLRKR